jgi:cyanophycin synthetase
MTKNFRLLLEEARALGLAVDIVYPEKEVVEISNHSKKIIVKEVFSIAEDPASASATLARNKEVTYRLWEREGVPFPRSRYFKTNASFPENFTALDLRLPVIFKKSNGKKSIGVRPNIASFSDLTEIVKNSSGSFIIQEMVFGREYRLLIYKGRLLGALEHAPPQIVGNGVDTINTLIQKKSGDFQKHILMNEKVAQTLKKNNLTLDSVPAKEQRVVLLETSCLSEGATSTDCTDIVHKDIFELAKKSAKAVNMKLAGIDLICEDISVAPNKQKISFLETNSFPSLGIHYTPMVGQSRRVIKDILEDIFNLV